MWHGCRCTPLQEKAVLDPDFQTNAASMFWMEGSGSVAVQAAKVSQVKLPLKTGSC